MSTDLVSQVQGAKQRLASAESRLTTLQAQRLAAVGQVRQLADKLQEDFGIKPSEISDKKARICADLGELLVKVDALVSEAEKINA